MKIRAADLIVQILVEHGMRHAFLVTGGGAMHLNDAFGRNKKFQFIACHHEQACAIAAESYARLTGELGVVNVTTGPGGINALNGIFGAWTDSLPVLVVSGQTKRETCLATYDIPGLRQLGDQEVDIISMVRSITKYAVLVTDPREVRYHTEKAIYLALNGRPGPTWIDIPIDVQSAEVETDEMRGFDPALEMPSPVIDLAPMAGEIIRRLRTAQRPVVLVGAGVRIGRALEEFRQFVEAWGLPATTAWNAHDAIWDEHPCYVGRPGTVGNRSGNFAVQNADLLIVLGCRLNIRQIGYNWKSFARGAFKIMVDIDEAELKKPTLSIDLPVCADVRALLRELLLQEPAPTPIPAHATWLDWCKERQARYPVNLKEYWDKPAPVNPYCLFEKLFRQLPENEIVVCADGTACVSTFHAAFLKPGQRLYTNSGCASMGYDLPAAIGACLAANRQRTICLAGDGSIQMNLQELQTILTHRLPIKIFLLNNEGYHSIRQTQTAYFSDNFVGFDAASGIEFPSFERLAAAYGYPYRACRTHAELAAAVAWGLEGGGDARICEIFLDPAQPFAPRIVSRRAADGTMISPVLEDMAPFLSEEEMRENMLIPTERL